MSLTNSSLVAASLLLAPPGGDGGVVPETPTLPDSEAAPPAQAQDGAQAPGRTGEPYREVLEPYGAKSQDRDKALELFTNGNTLYNDGQSKKAIPFLVESYKLSGNAALLYSLGLAHRRLYQQERVHEDRDIAIRRFEQYVRLKPDGSNVDTAQQYVDQLRVQALQDELAAVQQPVTQLLLLAGTEGAVARIDGAEALQLPTDLEVEPGRHSIAFEAPGFETSVKEVTVSENTSLTLTPALTELPGTLLVTGPKGARVEIDAIALCG